MVTKRQVSGSITLRIWEEEKRAVPGQLGPTSAKRKLNKFKMDAETGKIIERPGILTWG